MLDRWPDKTPVVDGGKFATPIWQRWFQQLVLVVNGIIDSAAALAVLVAANTAAIAAQAILIAANTAAIALLQPTYGTWTPTDASGAGLTLTTPTSNTNLYAKWGKLVLINGSLTYPVTANGATAMLGGLPAAVGNGFFTINVLVTDSPAIVMGAVASTSTLDFRSALAGTAPTNANMSGKFIYFSGCYRTA